MFKIVLGILLSQREKRHQASARPQPQHLISRSPGARYISKSNFETFVAIVRRTWQDSLMFVHPNLILHYPLARELHVRVRLGLTDHPSHNRDSETF